MGHDTVIPERVREAVAAVQARGIHFTLATGRGFPETLPFAQELNISVPIICYQGGLIKHPVTGALLYRAMMARDLALSVVELAHAHNWHLVFYIDEDVYLEEFRHSRSFYRDMLGLNIHCVDNLARVIKEHTSDPSKFLFVGARRQADQIQSEMNARFADQVHIVRSHTLFVEGNPLGVNKGDALRRLSEHLGIAQAQVMAIGDQGNDIPMLSWAGLGVAMENGSRATHAVADWIAPPLSSFGAAVAMERFLLDEQKDWIA
jgi:Cof subfamily protein (haloacid dehalogenase superfamily)